MASSSPSDESPTLWVEQLRGGNAEAAQKLWQTYFAQLVRLARRRVEAVARRAADEEDVALSAFQSFFRGIENGRFPQLNDRHDLWKLLVTITLNKASHLARDQGRQKRGGGWNPVEPDGPDGQNAAVDQLAANEPSPEVAAQLVEEFEHLLARLSDKTLSKITVWKLEGFTNAEIAEKLNVAERTVERKLKLIRATWEEVPEV